MPTLSTLIQLAEEGSPGPSPSFDRAHLLLAFFTIGESGTIGRQALAKKSNLGEGAIRTVIKKLREQGLAQADPNGCHLTPSGRRLYRSAKSKFSSLSEIGGASLALGKSQVALAVRGGGSAVTGGIEQRDSAILVGASGATTYVIHGGKFTVPGESTDCEKDFPGEAWGVLRAHLKPKDGDAVILCGAKDAIGASLGALAAALTLF